MIRPATRADAAGIGAIWNPVIRDTTITFNPDEKSEDEIAALLAGPDPCFVWEEGPGGSAGGGDRAGKILGDGAGNAVGTPAHDGNGTGNGNWTGNGNGTDGGTGTGNGNGNGGGRILGFARHFQFRGGAGYRHTREHTVLLHRDGQGRGIGRALMGAVIEDARAAGHRSLFAGVSGENPAGVTFHAALGFATVAVLPEVGFKFGRWIDLVLMQKRL